KTSLLVEETTLYFPGMYLFLFLFSDKISWVIMIIPAVVLLFNRPARLRKTKAGELYTSVVIMERLEGLEAIDRANVLNNLVKGSVKGVKSIGSLLGAPHFIFMLFVFLTAFYFGDLNAHNFTIAAVLYALISIFLSPLVGVLNALIYF